MLSNAEEIYWRYFAHWKTLRRDTAVREQQGEQQGEQEQQQVTDCSFSSDLSHLFQVVVEAQVLRLLPVPLLPPLRRGRGPVRPPVVTKTTDVDKGNGIGSQCLNKKICNCEFGVETEPLNVCVFVDYSS